MGRICMKKRCRMTWRWWRCCRRQTATGNSQRRFAVSGTYTRLSTKKDESVSKEQKEQVQELRAGIKDALASVRMQYFYDRPEVLEETFYASGVVVRALTRLVERFMEKLTEKKREKNILDFSDLEHLALEILRGTR